MWVLPMIFQACGLVRGELHIVAANGKGKHTKYVWLTDERVKTTTAIQNPEAVHAQTKPPVDTGNTREDAEVCYRLSRSTIPS